MSFLELGGVAALIHSFYNGMENVLKQALKDKNLSIPDGASWHRDLVYLSASKFFLSETTETNLNKYLSFRHYFVHNYSIDLNADELEPLVQNADNTFELFKIEIENYLKTKRI